MNQPLFVSNTITIQAPAAKLWDALTNPEQTKKYMFGCAAVSDWQPGSPLEWIGVFEGKELVAVKGHIVRIEPGHLLEYTTFDPNSTLEDVPENYLTVTYELKPEKDQVVFSVSQGDFATVAEGERRYKEVYNEGNGWMPLLVAIKQLVEQE